MGHGRDSNYLAMQAKTRTTPTTADPTKVWSGTGFDGLEAATHNKLCVLTGKGRENYVYE